MPKININGTYRDMTAEEEAKLAAMAVKPEQEESRLDEMEAALLELAAVQAEQDTRQAENEAALLELAAIIGGE